MKGSRLLTMLLLLPGIVFSTFSCSNDGEATINKMTNELSELRNQLNDLKKGKEQLERNMLYWSKLFNSSEII